jgi:hypothetical protein
MQQGCIQWGAALGVRSVNHEATGCNPLTLWRRCWSAVATASADGSVIPISRPRADENLYRSNGNGGGLTIG